VQAGLGATQFRKSGSGSVVVAAPSLTGKHLLPEIIADFRRSHPGVRGTAAGNARAGDRLTSVASR
jgi:DNA-binding transcriptional LysR family regulator